MDARTGLDPDGRLVLADRDVAELLCLLRPSPPTQRRLPDHGADPHLLPHHRPGPLGRLLRGARVRGAPAAAHSRGGDQHLHGPARETATGSSSHTTSASTPTSSAPPTVTSRSPWTTSTAPSSGSRARGSSRSGRRTPCATAGPCSASSGPGRLQGRAHRARLSLRRRRFSDDYRVELVEQR